MATFSELVKIVITADSKQAVASIRAVGVAAEKDMKKATAASRNLGDSFLKTGAILTVGGVAAFAAASAATMKFDKAMSAAGAVAGATGKQLAQLRQAALDAGADTAFSATQAADGIGELSRAGIATADILRGGLRGALDLAAAGELELADAATIAAQAMNIFDLSGDQVAHVADVLAAGANKSAASVGSLGEGLSEVGAVAAAAGLGLEDTTGTLALFADNAVAGSEAGNALKSFLVAIQAPSSAAADAMRQYGIDLFDARGNFIGLDGAAQQLKRGLAGVSQEQRAAALATIFGNRGLVAANILYKEGGAGVREYAKAVNDQGAAAEVAAKRMDNLAGDIEKLRGSVETALIEGGSQANGALRLMVQSADAALGAFSALPAPIQTATTALIAFSGVSLLASGAVMKFGPALRANVAHLGQLVGSLGRAAVAARAALLATNPLVAVIAGIGAAMFIIGDAVGYFDDNMKEVATSADDLAKTSLRGLTAALSEQRSGVIAAQKEWNSHNSGLAKKPAVVAHAAAMGQFNKVLKESPQYAALFIRAMGASGHSTASAQAKLDAYLAKQRKLGPTLQAAAVDQAALNDAVTGGTTAFEEFLKPVNEAAERTSRYVDAVRSTYDANFALLDSQGQLADAMKSGTGEEQAKALLDVAGAARTLAEFQAGPGASEAEKTKLGIDAQIASLQGLAVQYPQMAPFINGYIGKLGEATLASGAGAVSTDAAKSALRALRDAYPEVGPEIDKLIVKMEQLDQKKTDSQGANATAISVLQALKAKYEELSGPIQRVIDLINEVHRPRAAPAAPTWYSAGGVRRSADGGVIPGFASGGTPMPGISWVGERGPELAVFPQGARILSHADSMRAVRGRSGSAGSAAIIFENVTVQVLPGHPSEMGAQIVDSLAAYVRSNGSGALKKLAGV